MLSQRMQAQQNSLIGYEFNESNVPPHKCSTLDTVKVSASRTNLVCRLCKKIVGCWDDIEPKVEKIYPEVSRYSKSVLNDNKQFLIPYFIFNVLLVRRDDIPTSWPHSCKASRTWIRTSDTQYRIICSFCKATYGWWNFTFATESDKVYPQEENAKFTTEQKHDLR